jgi:ubiquinone/menaquinone biosynthesis C-methylase UbiE
MSTEECKAPDTCVCPWWFIRSFDNPLRRLFQKPEEILSGQVRPGYHCLDLGCGYGYFTIPMARMVGTSGSVTAADLQPQMLAGVDRRAKKTGLASVIRLHKVESSGIPFDGMFDFALAFWMLHEVPDQKLMLGQICRSLRPGGRLLLVEPKGHVKEGAFNRTLELAESVGMKKVGTPVVAFSRTALLAGGVGSGR